MSIKTYLVADARFFDSDAAAQENMTVNEYNDMIINNINKEINDEDSIIFMGIITANIIKEDNKQLFNRIKGKKYIIDFHTQEILFKKEEWSEIGFTHIWDSPGAIETTIKNKETLIIIETDEEDFLRDRLKTDYYIAVPQSISNMEELYKNKILNVSINKWGYEPLEIKDRLPRIFDDQELFLSMEDTEG